LQIYKGNFQKYKGNTRVEPFPGFWGPKIVFFL
jgi:hypothetical protein